VSDLASAPTTRLDVAAAEARIRPHLAPTPLLASALPVGRTPGARAERHGPPCFLKCENLQPTGSFKVRGALNKVLALTPDERARGVVTASTGNHGRAVAHALSVAGGRGTVYIPSVAPPNKVRALEAAGVEVVVHGDDSAVSEVYARRVAADSGRVFISPYNDADVVAGQATAGVEILAQCPDVDAIFVAVGGGGLVAGIASAVKAAKPDVEIVGCWPEHSQAMYQAMRAGRVVDSPELPTLSDGTAGGLEPGTITLEMCRALIDRTVLVSEAEIADAVRLVLEHQHLVVEGAAGVAVAAYRKLAPDYAARTSVIVLCGANIGLSTLRKLVCGT
jgi:threonine dehydratase